jgi:hypothetical protein
MKRLLTSTRASRFAGSPALAPPHRFLGTAPTLGGVRSMSRFSLPMAVQDRALVILIENGGVDLGIPFLVDTLLSATAFPIPDSYRTKLVDHLRTTIRDSTDKLLESADLYLNRFSEAAPALYGTVDVLRDSSASYEDLKGKLITLTRAGKVIDLLILTHGSGDFISVNGGIDGAKIRAMQKENGKPLALRSVYMMSCVGSSLNQAWIDAGARVASGALRNNYLPEPTMYFFWNSWKEGQSFENAVTLAFRRTVNMLNEAVRSFVRSIPIPGTGAIANLLDLETFDFVVASSPVINGQRTITINSDDVSFTQGLSSSLTTCVLPRDTLESLARPPAERTLAASHSYTFSSPSTVQSPVLSHAQSPAVAVIAGMEVADAAQIGLAAIGLAQQVHDAKGSFDLTYTTASRLLTNEARQAMPGAQKAKRNYSRSLLWIGIHAAIEAASADLIIEWDGNAYGEIGTAVIRKRLDTSTEWTRSSARVGITKVDRIPLPQTDPRTWPIVYTYEGFYDPYANGYFEFSGEFEINAFGGLRFNRHQVVSRSFADWAIGGTPEDKVQKGQDVVVPVPTIPKEQVDYLRARLP